MESEAIRKAVDQFILDRIDSVPHLEALLIMWRRPEKHWSADEMANELYVTLDRTRGILDDLAQQGLIAAAGGSGAAGVYRYQPGESEPLIRFVDQIYRREIVRISTMIHSKPSAGVREFARAFRFKKGEKE